MTDKSELLRKVAQLDERRMANEIALAIGKWGIDWLFDVCIEVFQDIVESEKYSCCEHVQAYTRILLFKSFKHFFDIGNGNDNDRGNI